MKNILPLLFLLIPFLCFPQDPQEDREAILKMLQDQQAAWNAYDLEGYMEPYWNSPELTFYGSSGVVKGWQSTLERYRKSYPSREHFGQLEFQVRDISKISGDAYTVMGEYHLERPVGNARGIFMLVVKKMEGRWTIIADTSSAVE